MGARQGARKETKVSLLTFWRRPSPLSSDPVPACIPLACQAAIGGGQQKKVRTASSEKSRGGTLHPRFLRSIGDFDAKSLVSGAFFRTHGKISLTLDDRVPKLKVDFLEVPRPLRGIKGRATAIGAEEGDENQNQDF